MNVLNFPPIKISLLDESKIKDFFLSILDDPSKKSVSVDTLDEDSWRKLTFSPRRRRLTSLLGFFLISGQNIAISLNKKLKRDIEKIDVNRLLYDLFSYCQKKEKGVVFLGFDQKDQIAIKKNLSLGEEDKNEKKSSTLPLYFLSNLQLRAYSEESVRIFLKKMQPRLVICNDAVFFSSFGPTLFDIVQDSNFLFFLIDKKTKYHLAAKYSKKSRFSLLIHFLKFLLFPFFFVQAMVVCPFKLASILVFYVTLRRANSSDHSPSG